MASELERARARVYAWLDAVVPHPGVPGVRRWRTVTTDTESNSGFGPVCPFQDQHPLLDYGTSIDAGPDGPTIPIRDTDGVYDCCPHVVETFSEALAAYLVAVLNQDGASHGE